MRSFGTGLPNHASFSTILNYIQFFFSVFLFFSSRFGRKPTVVYSFLSSGVACILVAFIPSEGGRKNSLMLICE